MKLGKVYQINENGSEVWTTDKEGIVFTTHSWHNCYGQYCSIHNPSDHYLKDAPMNWRPDRGIMERICEHGIGHNDPDDTAYRKRMGFDDSEGVHGCCGCCIGISYG